MLGLSCEWQRLILKGGAFSTLVWFQAQAAGGLLAELARSVYAPSLLWSFNASGRFVWLSRG